MLATEACEALRLGRVIRVRVEKKDRWLEVHAVGKGKDGRDVMRVFQIRGGDIQSEAMGWRLIRLEALGRGDYYREEREEGVRRRLKLPANP